MATATETINRLTEREYEAGFVTDIEQETLPPGLDEDTVRFILAETYRQLAAVLLTRPSGTSGPAMMSGMRVASWYMLDLPQVPRTPRFSPNPSLMGVDS